MLKSNQKTFIRERNEKEKAIHASTAMTDWSFSFFAHWKNDFLNFLVSPIDMYFVQESESSILIIEQRNKNTRSLFSYKILYESCGVLCWHSY